MNRNDLIDQLTNKAKEMKNKADEIKKLKHELEQTETQYNILSSQEIPFLMSQIGMQSFTLSDGTFFTVKPILVIHTAKDRMDAIDQWLTEHGHGGMVKTKIDISLPKASRRLPEIEEALKEMGVPFAVAKDIHYQTLNKWGREMEAEGMVIPEDLFTVFRTTKTYIE